MKESPYIAPPQVQQKESGFDAVDTGLKQRKPFFSSGNPQQPFFSPKRSIIQRTPDDTGTMHGGVADQYRSSRGLTGEDGPSTAEIVYQLSNPVHVLNHESYTSQGYSAIIQAWPDSKEIWPVLNSRRAKLNFLRFILNFDQTNCRPYSATIGSAGGSCKSPVATLKTFTNACQGFATQMYARYTSGRRMDVEAATRLFYKARIDIGIITMKFRIPIFIVIVPGHAFNAVQIGDDANDAHSYIFFEPQNDQLFTADDRILRDSIYARAGIFSLNQLIGISDSGQFDLHETQTFIMDSTNKFTGIALQREQRIALDRILRDIFIVDDRDSWNVLQRERPGVTYETYVRESLSDIPDERVAMVFRYINGRSFRRTPGGQLETMNRSIFIALMNRPALEKLIH